MSPVHDYVIDNSTGANVRSDINNVLQAILTNNSSSSAPSTTAAYMWWADTTNGVLKIRNSSNNDWVELLQLDGTLTLEDGSASTPGLAFRDDLNTGIFSSAADTFNVATAGVERMELGATTIFNESGADVDFRIEGDTQANLFYVDAGNDRVGIGRSDPQTTFHSTGTTNGQQATFGASSAGLKISTFAKTNNDAGVILDAQQSSNGTLTFATTSSERMRIDSSGELQFTSTDQIFRLNTSDGSDNKRFIIAGGGASGQNRGGQVVIHGNEYSSAGGKIQLLAGNASTDGTVDFFTGGSERMRIDSSGNLLIGTTAWVDNHFDNGIYLAGSTQAGMKFMRTASGSAGTYDIGIDTDNAFKFVYAGDSGGTGAERMRIDSSGRLMIGTTTEGGQFADDLTIANSGHTGITIRSGTDNVGSLYFSDGTSGDDEYRGAVQYNHTSNFLRFYSDATERMRIDSSGKVGINETNPARLLSVSSSSTDTYNISNATTVDAILLKNSGGNASGRNIGIQMNGGGSNGEVFLHLVGTSSTESAFYIGNRSGATRRVRLAIEPTGRLICGTSGITSNTAGGQVEVHGAIGFNDTGIAIKTTTTDTSSRSFMKFMNASNSVQGSIGMGGSTGVDYNTSSDYRLKENETVISDGITRVKQLIARKFNFKIEPDKTVDGFFAHEVSSIVPEAITGEKDAMKAETFYEEGDTIPSGKSVGDPKTYSSTEIQPQQIDQSKLVPLLVAAVQELITKVETLEAA